MVLSPTTKQTIYALGALFNMMTLGMAYGFPAILGPALQDPASDIVADRHQTSWLVSISGVSGLVLVFTVGPLMHIYGRRVTHIFITVPVLAGWILTFASYNLPVLFVARCLHSLTGGAIYFLSICIGEFSNPRVRSMLLGMKLLFVSLGIFIMHVLGYYLHWRQLALVPVGSTLISLIITIFWNETPDWLVSKGHYDLAEKVFYEIRGRSKESEIEIKKLVEEYKSKTEMGETVKAIDLKSLNSRVMWRPVALLCCAIIIPEAGGRHFFPSYSIQLAVQISGDESRGFFYTYIADSVSVLSSLLSCYFVQRFKRRKLILYSGYLACALLVTLSILIYVRANYKQSNFLACIILVLFIFYFFVVYSATFAVPYILMGELLPLEYRTIGTVINSILCAIVISGTVKVSPLLTDSIGVSGMLLIFSLCMLVTLLYLHYDLPETKERTLQDISDYFKGKSYKFKKDESSTKDHEIKSIIMN